MSYKSEYNSINNVTYFLCVILAEGFFLLDSFIKYYLLDIYIAINCYKTFFLPFNVNFIFLMFFSLVCNVKCLC